MSEETILQMVEAGTPPGYENAILEIRSPNGTKRITIDRLASVHKYLRFCDLCKELAFAAQCAVR
jgi:hypothetical protein